MARILLFGQARFGAEVLAGLLERGHEITAVSTPCDQPGGGADALAGEARARGLDGQKIITGILDNLRVPGVPV